jgi:hypothetical protein
VGGGHEIEAAFGARVAQAGHAGQAVRAALGMPAVRVKGRAAEVEVYALG